MPQYLITDIPVQVSQYITSAGLLTNSGKETLFLDSGSSVGPGNAGITLAPNQGMNWGGGVLWAVAEQGAVGALSIQYGADTTVSPITTATITGPVTAEISGPVEVTGAVTSTITGPVNAEITGPVTVTGGVDVAGSVTSLNGMEYIKTWIYNDPSTQGAIDVTRYASIVLMVENIGAGVTANGHFTMRPSWSTGTSSYFQSGDEFTFDTFTNNGSVVFDVKGARLTLPFSWAGSGNPRIAIYGSTVNLEESYNDSYRAAMVALTITPVAGQYTEVVPIGTHSGPITIVSTSRVIPAGVRFYLGPRNTAFTGTSRACMMLTAGDDYKAVHGIVGRQGMGVWSYCETNVTPGGSYFLNISQS